MTMKVMMKAHVYKRPVEGIIRDVMDIVSDVKETVASNTKEDGSPSSKARGAHGTGPSQPSGIRAVEIHI